MLVPPAFASLQEHIALRGDVDFWSPYLNEILARHGLTQAGQQLVPGYNVTYPTFLYGDVVVKLFGYSRAWRARHAAWSSIDVTAAAERSSLPPHLAAQAAAYVAGLGPPDPVVTHGDLTQNHAYVENGLLTGIIDWGDTIAADRHYEVIQLYRDMFRCDKNLLRVFLEAADWPAVDDFPRQALGMALHRQAVGLAQHHTVDVFMPIAERFPLHAIPTLDDLAATLFAF